MVALSGVALAQSPAPPSDNTGVWTGVWIGFALRFLVPLVAVFVWPNYWVAGGATLVAALLYLGTARIAEGALSDVPVGSWLLIGLYAVVAFGLARFVSKRRADRRQSS